MKQLQYISAGVLVCFITIGYIVVASAQPGTEEDPVVSLSYLESATELAPVVLEGGEETTLPSGRGIILLEGSARIESPQSDRWWIVNVTTGNLEANGTDMVSGNYYTCISGKAENSDFRIVAWRKSTIAIAAVKDGND